MDNCALIASHTTSHQAGIRRLFNKHNISIEYKLIILLTHCYENSFTDRNDYKYYGIREQGRITQVIMIGVYGHGKEVFGTNGLMGQMGQ
jgi:hypothetical protein